MSSSYLPVATTRRAAGRHAGCGLAALEREIDHSSPRDPVSSRPLQILADRQSAPFMLRAIRFVLYLIDSGQTRQMSRQDEVSRDGRFSSNPRWGRAVPATYLAKLTAEQRRAVEHGGDSLDEAPPLLIIAGAGSGKTNTLAHRVAHLIVGGVDPRRIMLLTFSRRAASEMQRRVERITAQVLGAKPGLMTDALGWSGTFHAIGARLLREYAP